MTTFIQQKFGSDCAVACLAMFLGVPYDRVALHVTGWELVEHGLTGPRVDFLAGLFGVEIRYRAPEIIDWERPAVLSVPSLNNGGAHAVFWDGVRFWDPQEGNAGKRAYSPEASSHGPRSVRDKCFVGYQRCEA